MMKGSPKNQQIFYSTYGILFLGVPNHSMDIQPLSPLISKKQGNEKLLHSLGPESNFLQQQNRQFSEALNFGDSEIVCFYETKTSSTLAQVGLSSTLCLKYWLWS